MNSSDKCSSDFEDKPKEGKEVGRSLQGRMWKCDCKGDNLGLNTRNESCLPRTTYSIKNSFQPRID